MFLIPHKLSRDVSEVHPGAPENHDILLGRDLRLWSIDISAGYHQVHALPSGKGSTCREDFGRNSCCFPVKTQQLVVSQTPTTAAAMLCRKGTLM